MPANLHFYWNETKGSDTKIDAGHGFDVKLDAEQK